MTLNFFLEQMTSVIAWIFLIASYWKNKDDGLLFLQVISCIFFILNYIFLGAYTGLVVIIFEIIRDIFYINLKNDKRFFCFSLPIYALIGFFTYDGIWSLFSIFASVCDGYALTYHGKKVVFLGLLVYVLWLIYDIYFFSIANIFAESILIISNLIILFTTNEARKKGITSKRY